jgi:glycosyltransferase involved in cell wall biosynthesis
MSKQFENLLVSSPNSGGLFLIHKGNTFRLDSLNTTGLFCFASGVLRGIQPAELCIYKDSVQYISAESVSFGDIHDVHYEAGFYYIVGTSGNEIIKLTENGEEVQRWVFPGEKDSWHINCLGTWNGRIVFSAFGEFREHRGYKGKTEKAGFLQDLLTGERLITELSQPHSPVPFGNNFLIANSEKMDIREFSITGNLLRSKVLDGYTRGIYVGKNAVYVGLSCSRNIEFNGLKSAAIVSLDPVTFEENGRIYLPTQEIYGIQCIDDREELIQAISAIASSSSARLTDSLTQRDGHIANLGQTVESLVIDRDAQKAGLEQLQDAFNQLSLERDEQVLKLNRVVAARDEQISSMGQTVESLVIDRDAQKAGLEQLQDAFNQLSLERDEQVLKLNRVVAAREGTIDNIQMELTALYNSKSWRLTSPLRKLVGWFAKLISLSSRHNQQNPQVLASTTMMQPVVPNMTSDEDKVTIAESKFRILLVSYYCPSRAHAGGLRILDIYALIRKQCPSVQLDLFTFHRPSIDWSLDDAYRVFHNVYLSPVEDLTPTTLTALSGSPLAYDLVDLQFHQSAYNIDAYKQVGKKVIFTPMESAAKVLFLDLRTNFHLSNFLPLRKFAASIRNAAEELVFIQKVDEVVCVSRADAAFLRALTSSRHIRGVDTGVSQFEFKEALALGYETTKAANKPVSVIYVAYFGSETNVLALRWYLEHVHPLVKASVPDYTLIVVGRGDLSPFSKYRDISVKFVGEVPSIAPHIKEARVSIAPALSGSGFRGKVNQYAVLGCPCVVSPIAFKGLSYQDGDSIFVAETPEVFADRCIQLLTDLDLNDRMGIAARQLCMERYSWASKWAAIREIYKLQGIA